MHKEISLRLCATCGDELHVERVMDKLLPQLDGHGQEPVKLRWLRCPVCGAGSATAERRLSDVERPFPLRAANALLELRS